MAQADYVKSIFYAALSLPVEARADLVERLLDSVECQTSREVDAAWAKEAKARLTAYRAGKIASVDAISVLPGVE